MTNNSIAFESMVNHLTFRVDKITEATVDNEPWVTVNLGSEPAAWVRKQPRSHWTEIESVFRLGSMFDMHEKLYSALLLKYGNN